MGKIKVILFDLDNTLIDFIRMKEESCRAAASAMVASGLRMDEAEAYEGLMETYFAVGIESNDAFSEFLKSKGQFSHKILAAAINAYLDAKNKCLKPYPNVKYVLGKLQRMGIFIAIVTDAPKTKAYQRLLSMGIESYFKFVVGFEDTNSHKTSGLPLLLAIEKVKRELPGISNSEILMVGDSMEKDMVPAKELGLATALSKYGQKVAENGTADYVLQDFEEIVGIL